MEATRSARRSTFLLGRANLAHQVPGFWSAQEGEIAERDLAIFEGQFPIGRAGYGVLEPSKRACRQVVGFRIGEREERRVGRSIGCFLQRWFEGGIGNRPSAPRFSMPEIASPFSESTSTCRFCVAKSEGRGTRLLAGSKRPWMRIYWSFSALVRSCCGSVSVSSCSRVTLTFSIRKGGKRLSSGRTSMS